MIKARDRQKVLGRQYCRDESKSN
ncbi:hypothetical protein THIARS_40263 [Thiomonas delicata]|uniref:Uncharacterized protein n=1 Tax=Thiomonas delicata TaxID=364030 RepID=A0A238D090_THIDL|nr:hypothetical protein THIARS_40263 [Thiomonas delicata]